MGTKKLLLIVNPCSGRAKMRGELLRVTEIFSRSGYDVTVYPTTDMEQEAGNGYVMLGSYEGTTADSRVYALNDEEYIADGETYMAGSIFVANARDIRPFEAYVYTTNAGRAPYLRIGKETTSIVLSL